MARQTIKVKKTKKKYRRSKAVYCADVISKAVGVCF